MDEARDTYGTGVCFAGGILAGQAIISLPGEYVPWVASALSLLCCVVCLALFPRLRSGALCLVSIVVCGIFCSLSDSLGAGLEHPSRGFLESCGESFGRLIDSIPFPHESTNGLVKALLAGKRTGLDAGTVKAFRDSGASHILALSGLHLGIIYAIASRILSVAGNSEPGRAVRSAAIIAATLFYTLATGAGASVVRAFIYICFNEFLSLDTSRKKEPARILLASLTIQLSLKPGVISELGFQLSYLAMLGLSTVFPRLKAWYPRGPGKEKRPEPMRKLWEAAAVSISCQIFTAPLVWIRFHTFPRYFLITNIVALPLSSALMGSSIMVAVLSAVDICPVILIRLSDVLAGILVSLLETISSM